MSLTSLLSKNTPECLEFQNILREIIPSKKQFYTVSGNFAFSNEYQEALSIELSNNYDYSVVGTAFDYLARIIIAKK